jgi:hypothetical protein
MFKTKIQQALDLLKSKASGAHTIVEANVGRIRAWDKSGTDINVKPLTINIAKPTFDASLTWVASVLAHESMHAQQFNKKETYSGLESEKKCNAHQLVVLGQIGAPQSEITYMMSQTGDHFDENKDGKYDWKDYEKRKY